MRFFAKTFIRAVCTLLVLPSVLLCAWGRLKPMYSLWAQFFALMPGIPGNYLRLAFYRLTLLECAADSCVSFGTFFAHREARLGPKVYIGSYCILGRAEIASGCQIASGVQILSGARQHGRDASGKLHGAETGEFRTVRIGKDSWIGAAAIVMADVGENSTVGAGAVVTRPVESNTVVVGNPARPLPPKTPQSTT